MQQYNFALQAVDLAQPGLTAYLEDSYLNTKTAFDLNGLTTVNFVIENTAGSKAVDRFRIVFRPAEVLPLTFTAIAAAKQNKSIAVSWKTTNELNVAKYEVEKSADGIVFKKEHTTAAQNTSSNSYSWLDESPTDNYNYYRVKSIDANGSTAYSKVVKVLMEEKAKMIVSPNPVANKTIQLQLGKAVSGVYSVVLFNDMGQQVFTTQLKHAAGTIVHLINLKDNIAKGLYRLEIIAADSTRTVIPISIL